MKCVSELAQVVSEMGNRIEVKRGDMWKRLTWPFDEKENLAYLSKLERFKGTFTLALQIIEGYDQGAGH